MLKRSTGKQKIIIVNTLIYRLDIKKLTTQNMKILQIALNITVE